MRRVTDLKAAIRAVVLGATVLALLLPAAVPSIHGAEDTLGSSTFLTESTGDPIAVHLSSVDASRFPDIYVYGWVRDSDGVPIEGLTRDHFVLTEQSELEDDPVEQTISVSTVEGVVDNVAIALTIDRSGSMRGTPMANAKEAAKTLVDTLNAEDRCAVVSFATDVRLDHDFVGADEAGRTSLKNVIDGLSATGWTALYRAIYESVEHLSGEVGIPAVIVLTDGKNESQPPYEPDAAIALAQDRGVPVYTIGLGSVDEAVLKRIADETGGSYYYTPDSEELEEIYLEIAAAIQAQYLLAYRTHNRDFDGTLRTIEVTASYHGQIDSDTITYRVAEPPRILLTEHTNELISTQQPGSKALTVSAEITSDIGITATRLFYRTTGTGKAYTEIPMSANSSVYSAEIPEGDVTDPGVEFYITASDGVITSTSPMTRPSESPHQIAVHPNKKPVIVHDPVETASPWTDIRVHALVTDEAPYGPIDEVVLFYRQSNEVMYTAQPMDQFNLFHGGVIPASAVTFSGVDYYIRAVDIYGVRGYAGTEDRPYHITVLDTKRVAYIPVVFPDQKASLSISQLEEKATMVEEYYSQQSYGQVVIESEFITGQDGQHILLEKLYKDYDEYAGQLQAAREMYDHFDLAKLEEQTDGLHDGEFLEFLEGWSKNHEYYLRSMLITVDALEKAGFEVGVDYWIQYLPRIGRVFEDYDVGLVFEDYDSIVVIQPPRVWREFSFSEMGYNNLHGFAWAEWCHTSEVEKLGVWAHELGHSLFGWRDFYGGAGTLGSVGHWCVMGDGPELNPPSMVMSVNKVDAGWLYYSPAWMVQEVGLLHELHAGDSVYTYTPATGNVDYFIFEGRHPEVEQTVKDPFHSTKEELRPDRGIMIYRVQRGRVFRLRPQLKWHEYIPALWLPAKDVFARVTLRPNDVYVYEDLPSETKFTAWEENSTLRLRIDPFSLRDYQYLCLNEVSVSSEALAMDPRVSLSTQHYFDVGLQVYTEDGRMVGPDYQASKYRLEIDGVQTSGPILGGGPEWIAVPSHKQVYFAIDPTPAHNWARDLGINPLAIEVEVQAGFYDGEGKRTETEPLVVTISLDRPTRGVVENGEIKMSLPVETATGTGTAYFTPSHGVVEDLEALPIPDNPPSGYTFPHGMFSFRVTELDYDGQTITVTIDLPTPVPAGTTWWKHHDGQWHDYDIPITIDGSTITITLTDGGIGDIDGVADGIITDPGGPGYPRSLPPTAGSAYPMWSVLLAGLVAGASLLVLRRRQTQS